MASCEIGFTANALETFVDATGSASPLLDNRQREGAMIDFEGLITALRSAEQAKADLLRGSAAQAECAAETAACLAGGDISEGGVAKLTACEAKGRLYASKIRALERDLQDAISAVQGTLAACAEAALVDRNMIRAQEGATVISFLENMPVDSTSKEDLKHRILEASSRARSAARYAERLQFASRREGFEAVVGAAKDVLSTRTIPVLRADGQILSSAVGIKDDT
jgi:hypothetical protein